MKKIRAAIVGYGNIGKYVLEALEAAHHCFSEFVCSGFVSGTKKLLQVLIGIFVTAEVKFRIFEFFGFLFYDSGVLTVNFLRLGCFFVCDRVDRKSTRLNSSHPLSSRMPSSA